MCLVQYLKYSRGILCNDIQPHAMPLMQFLLTLECLTLTASHSSRSRRWQNLKDPRQRFLRVAKLVEPQGGAATFLMTGLISAWINHSWHQAYKFTDTIFRLWTQFQLCLEHLVLFIFYPEKATESSAMSSSSQLCTILGSSHMYFLLTLFHL